MVPLSCSHSFRFFLIIFWLCFADFAFAQDQGQPSNSGQPALGFPYDQPWDNSEKPKKQKSKASQQPVPAAPVQPNTTPPTSDSQPTPQTTPEPAQQPAAVASGTPPPSTDNVVDTTPVLQKPKVAKNEISASGDFSYGTGTITVPVGYSLNKQLGAGTVSQGPVKVSRNSDYFGGTISYSYRHAWFIDFSYAHGTSTGNADVQGANGFNFLNDANSTFTIDDNWYQAYLRYAFPGLSGHRFNAYLRAGVSYVQADLTMNAVLPEGVYHQSDSTKDILGNAGFGLGYSLYATRKMNLSLQVEGEGFYGDRSQQSRETLSSDAGPAPVTADIDNTLYGGIGRGTIQFEYRLGQANRFRIYANGGIQAKFTEIRYSDVGPSSSGGFSTTTSSELLWGPYVKLGLRYSF